MKTVTSWAAVVLGGLLTLIVSVCGCSGEGESAGGGSSSSRPNVVVISIDTLRFDRLGSSGYRRKTSPDLDQVTSRGVSFRRAIAQSPWTLPSHASLLTGLFPHRHGVTQNTHRLSPSIPTLAEVLGHRGYDTHAIISSPFLTNQYGLDRGFADHVRVPGKPKPGAEITNQAIQLIEDATDPFFLFLHYFDVHSSYTPREDILQLFSRDYTGPADGTTEQLKRFRDGEVDLSKEDIDFCSTLYDAEIRELDEELGRFFHRCQELGLESNTIFVLTSDHGEEFLEHGSVLHGRTMHWELLQVPLIWWGAGVPVGEVREDVATLCDVAPTILGRLGLSEESVGDGRDLFSEAQPMNPIAFAQADHNRAVDDSLAMMMSKRFKLCYDFETTKVELYHLEADPLEMSNVASEHPEVVGRFLERLKKNREQQRTGEAISERTEAEIRELEKLGYLDGP